VPLASPGEIRVPLRMTSLGDWRKPLGAIAGRELMAAL